ncbi:SDR family oxidoreductase [Blastomonas marina]|nr:SDR family oxidoreductase [Blastomonas marina]
MNKPSVLVTGGAKRIGAQIVRRFAEAGWHVVIHYGTSEEEAQALADELPSAEIIQRDLANSGSAVQMIDELAERLPDWRVLVNCASVFERDSYDKVDPTIFEHAMHVNALAPVRMAEAFLEHAKSSAGRRVIQLTDQKLANPNPDFFSYTMSKHAVAAAMRMLAIAHRGSDDRVYALAPGAILPSHDQDEAETEVSHRMNLLERKTDITEVADAALFLAEGTLASGETLYIDSGQHVLSQDRDVMFLARDRSATDQAGG